VYDATDGILAQPREGGTDTRDLAKKEIELVHFISKGSFGLGRFPDLHAVVRNEGRVENGGPAPLPTAPAGEPQWPVELADGREKVVACGLAAATSFGAQPTVLMVSGVPVAFLGANEAGDGTGFDHCADEAQIRRGLTGHDAAGRVAGVGAVEAETDAANHLPHVVLGEIGVGATRTAGGAIEALGDTAQDCVAIEARRLWVRLKDLSKSHRSPSLRLEA
jgi:hypothetical protein